MDEDLKNEAAALLAEMGLTVSDVVRIALTKIAREKALPFRYAHSQCANCCHTGAGRMWWRFVRRQRRRRLVQTIGYLMALQPVYSGRFRRDVKRSEKRGKDHDNCYRRQPYRRNRPVAGYGGSYYTRYSAVCGCQDVGNQSVEGSLKAAKEKTRLAPGKNQNGI